MKAFSIIIIYMVSFGQKTFAQREVNNSYLFDIDEPFQFNINLKKWNYAIAEVFTCSDSVFNNQSCICTKREFYDTSGRLIKLLSGGDLMKNKIDYTVNYVTVTDTICEVITRFSAAYVDSISLSGQLFHYDSIINRKPAKQFIYPREKNNDIIIRSILEFDAGAGLAKRILRYDVKGKLREIYYPTGNRKPTKETIDTVMNGDFKIISFNYSYPENDYQQQIFYNSKGHIIERKHTNISNGKKNVEREIFVYNDKGNLIRKLTVNKNNIFIRDETFMYKDSILVTYTSDSNLEDSIPNELSVYDMEGNLIEALQRSSGYPYDMWRYKYFFEGSLHRRTDYYHNGNFFRSTIFRYKEYN